MHRHRRHWPPHQSRCYPSARSAHPGPLEARLRARRAHTHRPSQGSERETRERYAGAAPRPRSPPGGKAGGAVPRRWPRYHRPRVLRCFLTHCPDLAHLSGRMSVPCPTRGRASPCLPCCTWGTRRRHLACAARPRSRACTTQRLSSVCRCRGTGRRRSPPGLSSGSRQTPRSGRGSPRPRLVFAIARSPRTGRAPSGWCARASGGSGSREPPR